MSNEESNAAPTGLALPALEVFFDDALPGIREGSLSATVLAGGRSNITYRVSDGHSDWVLRRPPLGHAVATAHDMSREYRVLKALQDTSIAAPAPLAFSDVPAVTGTEFYVMEYVAGPVFRTVAEMETVDASTARTMADGLVANASALHTLDPEAVGLGDLGRPQGYLHRQLKRWTTLLKASRSRELQGLRALHDRLAVDVPASSTVSLVHGDYRLDNLIFDPEGNGLVVAVLDWEMATLGDPLADWAYTVAWWNGVDGLDSPAGPGTVRGFPDEAALLDAYGRLTGYDLSAVGWYLGMAAYKIAAILESIYFRFISGLTVGDGFDNMGGLLPAVIERGHRYLDEIGR